MEVFNRIVALRTLRIPTSVLRLASLFVVVVTAGCSLLPDTRVGSAAPTNGGCIVSGGTNSGSVRQDCTTQVLPRIKSPYLSNLQTFYAQGAELLRTASNGNLTDEQIDAVDVARVQWVNTTYAWISTHITTAAAEKFVKLEPTALSESPAGTHKEGEQKKFSNTIITLSNWTNNLDTLMRSDEMYPQ
jgi:hypothetical protein